MERLLFFICTISALVITVQITTGDKPSLRQGPEEPETTAEDVAGKKELKKCKMCPRMYKPVCASNGKWYRNPCFMACEVGDDSSVNILYQGVCRPEHQHPLNITIKIPEESRTMTGDADGTKKTKNCTMCPRIYMPICASNGKWYRSACFMACEVGDDSSINILYEGICRLDSSGNPLNVTTDTPEEPETTPADSAEYCRCPKSYNPICASNGEWYQNPCIMACKVGNDSSINIIYEGVCRPEHSSSDNPPTVTTETLLDCDKCDATQFGFQPVCGADGKTYHNDCIMQCSNIKLAYIGKCVGPTPGITSDQHFAANNCSTLCPKVYDPVCATNGEWYYNRCIMYCTLGIKTDVKILYQGRCVDFWRKFDS